MEIIANPNRGKGLGIPDLPEPPISTDAVKVRAMLRHCPAAAETPLLQDLPFNSEWSVSQAWLKDERNRMGLGSFKSTGAAYVIAGDATVMAEERGLSFDAISGDERQSLLTERTYICASAGNHGLSVAAGARVFGAQAVIYLSATVPESFAVRLREYGAQVERAGEYYEASLDAAMARCNAEGWTLLSDTSWPGYTDIPYRIMEGYSVVADETAGQMGDQVPTHIMLQAGVGGVAGASAANFRKHWGEEPMIIVVEPEAAPALFRSVQAGKSITTEGPVSDMGRLDCKEPSLLALEGLSRLSDYFVLLSDVEVQHTVDRLKAAGIASTASALAGISVLDHVMGNAAARDQLGLDENSRVLALMTEQAADDDNG